MTSDFVTNKELEMDQFAIRGTRDVIALLLHEGFDVTWGYLGYCLRENAIASPSKGVGGVLLWTPADVDRLRSHLRRRERGPVNAEVVASDGGRDD
jgi:hypothetical protein